MFAGQAQIDDRLDASLRQTADPFVAGLASAKDVIVDDLEIGENLWIFSGGRPAVGKRHGDKKRSRAKHTFILPDAEI